MQEQIPKTEEAAIALHPRSPRGTAAPQRGAQAPKSSSPRRATDPQQRPPIGRLVCFPYNSSVSLMFMISRPGAWGQGGSIRGRYPANYWLYKMMLTDSR